MNIVNKALLSALALSGAVGNAAATKSSSAYASGLPCSPCTSVDAETSRSPMDDCIVSMKVNFFASETGYFEVEGCEGVNPTLHLTVGRTYLFNQGHETNWYHLIGFAYEADGAHVGVDELEPGVAPGDSNCTENLSCPAPMYWMAGKYTGEYSNIPSLVPIPEEPSDAFGLDAVEPLFFHPIGDWQEYGPFVTALNFDIDYDQDLFYFCHIHSGMSARIKLMDQNGNLFNPEDSPEIPYQYAQIDDFDNKCGTFNLTDFANPKEIDTCPDIFVCENDIQPETVFAECIRAMNCHMMASMTTNAVGKSALFCHQMIPHHQNAVNMAKALLHTHDIVCLFGEGWECELVSILYDIINGQNAQIMTMIDVLDQLGADQYENCKVDFTMANNVIPSRHLREPEFMEEFSHRVTAEEENDGECTHESGIDCRPCEGTTGDCTITVGVNPFAGEWGYYKIEGCEGVNPTLHLEVGRTYLFDQSDVSNWYHLIGFSYEPDGAHVGVDELEPGVAPGESDCAETNSCPAPMYWLNGTYTGVYSNIPSLVPIPDGGSDDFGLDVVKPYFFHPIGDWIEYGPFVTALNFDIESYDQDIFYFCHVHSGMSARIKLIGFDGSMLSESNTPAIPYGYSCVSAFDKNCGTYDLEKYQPVNNPQCPDNFVCVEGADDIGEMGKCIDSMDCAMLTGMTVSYGDEGKDSRTNDVILFLREMIPHHQNAVNMAKNLLKSGEIQCSPEDIIEDKSPACLLNAMVRAIINAQNSQIQTMQGILEGFEVAQNQDCSAKDNDMESDSADSFMAGSGAGPEGSDADPEGSDAAVAKSMLGLFIAVLAGFELAGLH